MNQKCVSCGDDLSMCIEFGAGKPGFQPLSYDSDRYVCSTACMTRYRQRKDCSLTALANSISPVMDFIPDCGVLFS